MVYLPIWFSFFPASFSLNFDRLSYPDSIQNPSSHPSHVPFYFNLIDHPCHHHPFPFHFHHEQKQLLVSAPFTLLVSAFYFDQWFLPMSHLPTRLNAHPHSDRWQSRPHSRMTRSTLATLCQECDSESSSNCLFVSSDARCRTLPPVLFLTFKLKRSHASLRQNCSAIFASGRRRHIAGNRKWDSGSYKVSSDQWIFQYLTVHFVIECHCHPLFKFRPSSSLACGQGIAFLRMSTKIFFINLSFFLS